MTREEQVFEKKEIGLAGDLSKRVSPKFFIGISDANKIDGDTTFDAAREEIAKNIETNEEISKAWSYLKTKGMRLFDGLKRIWRWVKKIGKKVVGFIKNNIFKAFFRYVSKAYKIVAKGIENIVKAFKVYFKR